MATYSVCSVMLLLLQGVASTSEECIAAFSDISGSDDCDTFDLTLDQLLTEPCPTACQEELDKVLSSCALGDSYNSILTSFEYEENTLFLQEGDMWASCNYGYEPSTCEVAYNHVKDVLPCNILNDDFSFVSIEQLETEECPSECQERYDYTIESCQQGDKLASILGLDITFGEAYLYHEQGVYRRKKCNVGYEPTACGLAVDALEKNAIDDLGLRPVNGTPPVCLHDENQDSCTLECTALIDAVISDCAGENSVFAPSSSFWDETFTRIPFRGEKTLEQLGLNPSGRFASKLVSLSEKCWNYYLSNSGSSADSPVEGDSSVDSADGSVEGSSSADSSYQSSASVAVAALNMVLAIFMMI